MIPRVCLDFAFSSETWLKGWPRRGRKGDKVFGDVCTPSCVRMGGSLNGDLKTTLLPMVKGNYLDYSDLAE